MRWLLTGVARVPSACSCALPSAQFNATVTKSFCGDGTYDVQHFMHVEETVKPGRSARPSVWGLKLLGHEALSY